MLHIITHSCVSLSLIIPKFVFFTSFSEFRISTWMEIYVILFLLWSACHLEFWQGPLGRPCKIGREQGTVKQTKAGCTKLSDTCRRMPFRLKCLHARVHYQNTLTLQTLIATERISSSNWTINIFAGVFIKILTTSIYILLKLADGHGVCILC